MVDYKGFTVPVLLAAHSWGIRVNYFSWIHQHKLITSLGLGHTWIGAHLDWGTLGLKFSNCPTVNDTVGQYENFSSGIRYDKNTVVCWYTVECYMRS